MVENKLLNLNEVCVLLNISPHTLKTWYNWESKQLKQNLICERYLPIPQKMEHTKGQPRMWTGEMVDELKEFKEHIVTGRNGKFGMYSNPNHKETKKYKQSIASIDNE